MNKITWNVNEKDVEMSQEHAVEASEIPKKEYMMLLNDKNVALLSNLMPGLVFIEVQGMNMTDNPAYQVVVTPTKNLDAKQE